MPSMPRGEPRSVPDPDGEGYDEMLRAYRATQEDTDATDTIIGNIGDSIRDAYARFSAKDANGRPLHPIGHPGLAESLIPVVGSGHEALADFQEGHPILGTGNAIMAGLEATGVGSVVDDGLKLGLRLGRSQTWGAIRKAALERGLVQPFQPGHHIIQRQYIAKWAPDWLTNNWLNIKPMTDKVIDGVEHTGAQIHRRLHGRAMVDGEMLPKFDWLQRIQYGAKPSTAAIAGVVPETAARVGANNVANNQNGRSGW